EEAREAVRQMSAAEAEGESRDRRQAARERARRERAERLESALLELKSLQAETQKKDGEEGRGRLSETEARGRKNRDHALAPSYNAQISTEAGHKVIVGVHLSQSSSDGQSLMPAVEQVKENLGQKPGQMVVDGGFTNRDNIIQCAAEKIDLVGSLPDP